MRIGLGDHAVPVALAGCDGQGHARLRDESRLCRRGNVPPHPDRRHVLGEQLDDEERDRRGPPHRVTGRLVRIRRGEPA